MRNSAKALFFLSFLFCDKQKRISKKIVNILNALFWCNHDQPRIVSRLGNEKKYWEESSGSKRKFWNAEA